MKFKYSVGTRVYYTGYLTKHRGFYTVAHHQTAAGKYMLCEDLHGNPDDQKILQLVQEKNILPIGFLVVDNEDSTTGYCSTCDNDNIPVSTTDAQQFCANCGAAWETVHVLADYEVDEPISYEPVRRTTEEVNQLFAADNVKYTLTYTCLESNDDCPGGTRFRLWSTVPADTLVVGDHIDFNGQMCRISEIPTNNWFSPARDTTLFLHDGTVVTVPGRTKVNVYKH